MNKIAQLTALLDKTKADQSYEHEQLNSLINSMADGVIAVNANQKITLYNAAALNVLDVNNLQAGEPIGKYLKPIDSERNPVDTKTLIESVKYATVNRDLRIKYSDDSLVNLYLAIAPVHMGYSKQETEAKGYVLVVRDITREKSLEEERDEFISVVSHELRTPIAIAEGNIGNAEFIVEKSPDNIEAVKTALKEAHNQTLFLADMINDLSTLSRAERGVLEVEVEEIDVAAFMQELSNNYTPQAAARGLTFHLQPTEGLGMLRSSKLYVREVLQNFITNAIKYTEQGSVTLSAQPGDNGIVFKVRDTGIGISKGDQERVFDKFFRSEDYRTRKANGTGLGLYVTMKLARLIHAEISVESQLNKGSTFSIFIPNFN